jgi:hypothetical protein
MNTVTITTTINKCNHDNGVYCNAKFKLLIIEFRKKYFCCTDCGKNIQQGKLKWIFI